MKTKTILAGLLILVSAACSSEPEPVIETVVYEQTVVVPQTVEVTRQVDVTVEVTRLVEVIQEQEVEVTRIKEVIVTATPEPTAEPTATDTPGPTNTPRPVATPTPAADLKEQLYEAMIALRGELQGFGGYIDAALRGSPFSCVEVVARYDSILNAPTFDVSGTSLDIQYAYGSYRAAVEQFANGTFDMVENCRQAIANQTGASIPALQWTIARTEVNKAINIVNVPIEDFEGV